MAGAASMAALAASGYGWRAAVVEVCGRAPLHTIRAVARTGGIDVAASSGFAGTCSPWGAD